MPSAPYFVQPWQPHQPFTFCFRQKTDTAALRVALIPEGKGRYITG